MIFASPFFLTVFLPAVLLSAWGLGWLCRRRGGADSWGPVNLLLLAASFLFYFWGEGWGVLWLLASIAFNAGCARLAAPRPGRTDRARRSYYQQFTSKHWGVCSNYNLALDSGLLGYDTCVKLICDAARGLHS